MSNIDGAHVVAQSADLNDSAATSVNGSNAATETTTATEASSTVDGPNSSTTQTTTPVTHKPASAPPKVNPWTTRAGKSQAAKSSEEPAPATEVVSEKSPLTAAAVDNASSNGQPFRRTHRLSRSTAPAIDDASLWPTLDKALGENSEAGNKKPTQGETNDNGIQSAPRVTGKEKWTKYTPTIIHTPLPSKSSRGASNAGAGGPKVSGRGGATARPSRERVNSDKGETGVDGTAQSQRSSETSRSRSQKTRSMSVSNARTDRVPRKSTQADVDTAADSASRSQSSKRSDRGSISAPSGNTPVSEASKSPQVPSMNGAYSESGSNGTASEQRIHRGSYDSNINTRLRGGGYRGTRGNYQNNYNTRYQNPANFTSQPHLQNNRMYQRDQMPYGFDQYQNFVNPAIAPVMIDPMVARHMVLNQCEYYFSIENLCKDMFLRKHMDSEGFVNLPILASFNRLRAITLDYALIRDVCVMSTLIELRAVPGSYDKIRRVEGWEQWVLPEDQRDASTKAVPEAVAEIPIASGDEPQADMSSNIGARAFVPGQASHNAQSGTTTLNENFANLGIGNRLSPEVKEFQSQNHSTNE